MESIPSGASFSLLIMEDDKLTCEAIGRMISFKFSDITVYTADSGRIGVKLFKEHKPEIVITDINMPDMDGIQVAREIKSIKSDTKFIVLTGYSDKNSMERVREIGCDNYMVKPINFENLFAAIEKCRAEITL